LSNLRGLSPILADVYSVCQTLYVLPPSLQPLMVMYIYQESWKSVLQPSTYTRLKPIHTRLLLVLGALITAGQVYVTITAQGVSLEEWYTSDVFTVLYCVYAVTLGVYAMQCISMTVLWVMAYKFRRLLPPSHQPTVLGVKLVKIDAIVVLSYLLTLFILVLMYLAVLHDRANAANIANPSADLAAQIETLMLYHTRYNSIYSVLNPLDLLLLLNLSLLWDKRPQWMRRDHATKRDTEGGAELFL
ncbi:hypothetical protein KIPB_002994, partial [Kipferlia bialata]